MTTVIVQVTARILTPVMFLLSLYLLVRGHHSPGGGFIAATVAGLSLVFRAYAFGFDSVDRLLRPGAARLIGAGLVLTIATGAGGWLWGDSFLAAASVAWHAPAVGTVELSTTLLFEFGVYVTVLSFVIAVVGELGAVER